MNAPKAVGIIGLGMVGGPLKRYFEECRGYVRGTDLFLFDADPKKDFHDDANRADIIFVSVPTPRSSEGTADTSIITSVLKTIAARKVVVIKSTVPPGTTESLQRARPDLKIVFNPEFLTEANAWENTLHPDRQLVGFTKQSRGAARRVLELLPPARIFAPSPGFKLSATEAELVKYGANIFLARKITFANAMFDLASSHKANYENVRKGIGADPRIGESHLNVHHHGYRGYGGYCFPKDTDALIAHAKGRGLMRVAELFAADRSFNEALLDEQGLLPRDVSMHDHDLIKKKVEKSQKNEGTS